MNRRPTRIEWTGWAACSALLHAACLALLVWTAAACRGCATCKPHLTDSGHDLVAAQQGE